MKYGNLAEILTFMGYTNFSCGETIDTIRFYLPEPDETGSSVQDNDATLPSDDDIASASKKLEEARLVKDQADAHARAATIAHAKSLGFTDEMISVMYPSLGVE